MVGHSLVPRSLIYFPDATAPETSLDSSLPFISVENWNVKLGDILLPLLNSSTKTS